MTSQSTPSLSINSPHKELTINDLPLLCNALNPVASKCFALGLQLGVEYPQIRNIERNYRTCEDQLREIISERLKQDKRLTWHDIVTALRSPSVNHPDLVRHVESWYISPSLNHGQLGKGSQGRPPHWGHYESDPQHDPSSDPQQHLSLGGERPYHMVMMGQTTVNRGENPNMTSVPISSLWGAPFFNQMGAPYLENYQPTTQMMGDTSVRGAQHGENYQPTTQMMGPTPVRGAPHGENYQSFPLMRGLVDIGPPDRTALRSPYMYLPHHMTAYQAVHPNTLSTTQPYPTAHTQGSSATAYHRSPMDTFVHYVKSTYKQYEIEKNLNVLKWPPTPSKIFINLACIDWESVVSKKEADEYTRAMVEDGNVDVIMKEKTNIDFSDIVRDLPPVAASEKVVLVEGAPGVGKSTFAWEFCRRWERGEIAQQYQLVLLLRLRDDGFSRAKNLRDIIYHSSESVCQAVVEELESTFGVNTLIILEGFDELPVSQRKDSSIFLQLILGKLLLYATIMITSRPWATGALLAQFKHRIFQHVEILGFTEENIIKYVTSVFTGEGKKTTSAIDLSVGGPDEVSEEAKKNIDDVMAYIDKYPQIKACMYIPLNAAIVVSIYRESMKSKWVLPTTLTELYQALARILLLRHLCGHAKHQKCRVGSFEDLPGEVYSQFLDISKIAYNGICAESESVQLIFPDIPDDFETLGLMQSVSQLFMDGQKTSHNFLHLTFQEFLASFLISTMSPADQLEHFQRHEDGRLRVVLRFLAGLTKLNKVTPDQLRSLLGEPIVEPRWTQYCNRMRPDICVSAHHTNWLFEAQNSELLQSLFHNHTASFTFTRGMLPLEYYSVGYCIAHSHSKWSLIFNEDTEEEKLHMLVNGAKTGDGDYSVAVKTISTYMTPEKMHIILNGLSACVDELYLNNPDNGNSLFLPPLSTLHILELQIDDNKSAFNIYYDLSFSSLEALIISSSCKGTTLGAKTREAIGKLLSSTTSLKEFHLFSNPRNQAFSAHVSNEDMEVITKGLSDNIALPLKSLDIDSKCTFTTTATRSLVQFITSNTTLQCLEIHIDRVEDVDIFTKALSDIASLPLKSLDIDCKCTVTTTATRSLVQFITRSTTLQYIRICHVTFSAQGLIELTEATHHCSRLQKKKLEKLLLCVEYSEDVVNLRHIFKDHPDMKNSIDWNEVTEINQSVKKINETNALTLSIALEYVHITSLTLSNKSIGDVEGEALAPGLYHCSTLESLYLFNNSISDAGTVALAQALHHNSTLEWLDLSNNNIGDVGAVALAQALHRNSILKKLDLSNNSISDAGAVALAQALHHNSTLVRLHLYGNDAIGKEGTHQLVKALTVNTSITKITPYGDGLILPRSEGEN